MSRPFQAVLLAGSVALASAASPAFSQITNPLVLALSFEEDEEGIAVDSSPQSNHGLINGAISIPHGVQGKALRLDGIDDHIRVPRHPSLEPESLTVSAWLKVHQYHPNFGLLVHKRNASFHNNEAYDLQIWNGGAVRAVAANGTQSRLDSSVRLGLETWHHVTMVFDRPALKLYIDGACVGTRTHDFPLAHNPDSDLLIGATDHAYYPMDLYLNCDIDELRIYDTALDDAAISALYHQGADALATRLGSSTGDDSPPLSLAEPAPSPRSLADYTLEICDICTSVEINNGVVMRWSSLPGARYELLWSTNLEAGFTVIASNLVARGSEMTYTHDLRGAPVGYYSVKTRE